MKRVIISIPEELLARIDARAKEIGISRASFIRLAAAQFVKSKPFMT